MMEYKGYLARVEFDDSAGVLHGGAVDGGPYPVATFEATDASALRREFERSVDECLAWCEEDGVEPRTPMCGEIGLRLGAELHVAVERAARAKRMSVDAWIVRALRGAVERVPESSRGEESVDVRRPVSR